MQRKYIIILSIVAILIVIRLLLPTIILRLANKELAEMEGYFGKIEDVDLAIYRGAYTIDSIYINRVDTIKKTQTPFISARKIDLSVEWRALFKGRIVGELDFVDPVLKFTKDKAELNEVQKDTADFRILLKKFMPLTINKFEIINGKLSYVDNTSNPKVDISMDKAYIVASNLSNVQDTSLLPSVVTAHAHIYKGDLELNMKMDLLSKDPLFDMNVNVEQTSLPELNEFFKAYAKFDVNKGEFNMYAEVAAKEGKFTGYIKPVIKNLDVVGPEDDDDNFLRKAWENFIGFIGVVVENPKKDQVATRIPLNGSFENAEVGVTTAVVELLRNAFIEALYPAIDQQISISSVDKEDEDKPGFFKRVFGKDKNDDEKELSDNKNDDNKKKKDAKD